MRRFRYVVKREIQRIPGRRPFEVGVIFLLAPGRNSKAVSPRKRSVGERQAKDSLITQGLFQFFRSGNIDQGNHHPVNHIIQAPVGHDSSLEPVLVR